MLFVKFLTFCFLSWFWFLQEIASCWSCFGRTFNGSELLIIGIFRAIRFFLTLLLLPIFICIIFFQRNLLIRWHFYFVNWTVWRHLSIFTNRSIFHLLSTTWFMLMRRWSLWILISFYIYIFISIRFRLNLIKWFRHW